MNARVSRHPSAFRVLVVHYNTPDLTSALVRALPSTTPAGRPVSVHLLDNHSTTVHRSTLRDNLSGLDGVRLTVNAENVGFGEGLNQLTREGDFDDADILWFLNPDTRLEPGCLGLLENEIDAGDFGMVSPLVFSGDDVGSWIWYCGGTVGMRDVRPCHHLHGRGLTDAPAEPFETGFITGAAPMMRAGTFRVAGGFPPGYFLYWEDAYLSWRVKDLGMRLGVVPAARLWHAVGASTGVGQSSTFYYWFARNRFLFARDVGVARHRLFLGRGALESVRILLRALREPDDKVAKTYATVRGTLAGGRLGRIK